LSGIPPRWWRPAKILRPARIVQSELSFENLRVYRNDDLIGTELGAQSKNVMAIARNGSRTWIRSNSVAALITRGLAEMTRLALREGANWKHYGSGGPGDLVLTCTEPLFGAIVLWARSWERAETWKRSTASMHEIARV